MKQFNSVIRILAIPLTIALLTCISCESKMSDFQTLPYYKDATFTPHWLDPSDKALQDFHQISGFSFTNQEGQKITEKTFDNKIYVTDFFFTICPGICPKMTANLALLQDEFIEDDDVLLLSHSVTPTIDSIPRLKAYAIEKGVNPAKWHLVTGDQQEIYRMGRLQYFVEEDLGLKRDIDEFLHTENFVLVDKQRRIRGIYNGLNEVSIQNLIDDIKILKLEGSSKS